MRKRKKFNSVSVEHYGTFKCSDALEGAITHLIPRHFYDKLKMCEYWS